MERRRTGGEHSPIDLLRGHCMHFGRGRSFRDRNRGKQMAMFKDGHVQVVMTVRIVVTVDIPIDGV